MGRLQVKAADCKYKENEGRLKEQFINGLNDKAITVKITKKLMVPKDTSKVTSDQVLVWGQRVKAQRSQKALLENIRLWIIKKGYGETRPE